MTVKVTDKQTGKVVAGKYAVIQEGNVNLFSGCMSDKKGGIRGCGKKTVFPAAAVTVTADDPAKEIKTS